MVMENEPSDEELEFWEKQQEKMWEEEYERYIAGQNEGYLGFMAEEIKKCMEQSNKKRMHSLNEAFKAWHRLHARYKGFLMIHKEYPEAIHLADMSLAITENVYDSIFASASGRYKLAMESLRGWLEQYLTVLYFSLELRGKNEGTPIYNEIMGKYRGWTTGQRVKRFSGDCGIIEKVINHEIEDAIFANVHIIGIPWYPKDRTLDSVVTEIHQELSKIIHLGIGGKIDLEFDRPPIPFTYSDAMFDNWFDFFKKIDDITTLLILLHYPKSIKMSDEDWKESFQFDKQSIKSMLK